MSSMIARPALRETFFLHRYQPNVYFYTSNLNKYLQARMLLARYGVQLQHFRRVTPYEEDYSLNKQAMLRQAVGEIRRELGEGVLFFIEDTSLRLEALSEDDDVPGLAVKEWFQSTSFQHLDNLLKERGRGREAIIKSDIALHIPNLDRPIFFHGTSEGAVAPTSPEFRENERYPWLTPNSFNGWFIPHGAQKRLGEMSVDESMEHDFRIRALVQMVDRLEEYTTILNLPPTAIRRKSRIKTPTQLQLMPATVPALLVIGPTCVGKTTMGEYLRDSHGLMHIEASSIVRMMKQKAQAEGLRSFDFARDLLAGNPAIVAERVIEMFGEEFETGFVITGFRTIEEVERLRALVPDLRIIALEASPRVRFSRNLERCRDEFVTTFEEFIQTDVDQATFGLLEVAEQVADFQIVNEGSLQDFHNQVDALMGRVPLSEVHGVNPVPEERRIAPSGQLVRCLDALNQAGRPLTLREIESFTGLLSRTVKTRDANKVLKGFKALAARDDARPLRYQITDHGRAFLRISRLETGSHGGG
jgi:inosine/xanthosine triphosphate pyrophosphatase family protein/dephospho-CoA kinase